MFYQYFIEVSIIWLIFFLFYQFLLGYETFFQKNRYYLLSSVLLGLMIPLLHYLPIRIESELVPITGMYLFDEGLSIAGVNAISLSDDHWFSWSKVLWIIYFLGVVIGFTRLMYGFKKIFNLKSEGELIKKIGYCLVITDTFHLPFSFFNLVFINQKMLNHKSIRAILDHEITHVKYVHSLDVLFIELVSIFFWWNPIIYMYRRALKATHEFLADKLASNGSSGTDYSRLLLSHSESSLELSLTHQFFQSHLKNRINMLNKSYSSKYRRYKYLLSIPMAAFLVILFVSGKQIPVQDHVPGDLQLEINKTLEKSNYDFGIDPRRDNNLLQQYRLLINEYADYSDYIENQGILKGDEFAYNIEFNHDDKEKFCISKSNKENATKNRIHPIAKRDTFPVDAKTEIFKVVEEMPRFIGCDYEGMTHGEAMNCSNKKLIEYIGEHLIYPAKAKKAGVEGMVVVQFTVNKSGMVDDVKVIRDIGKGCGEAGAKVVREMNKDGAKWIPGKQRGKKVNVQYNLPLRFKLPKAPPAPPAPPEAPEAPASSGNKTNSQGMNELPSTSTPSPVNDIDIPLAPPPPPPPPPGPKDDLFDEVDEMPRFPGCENQDLAGQELTNCSKKQLLEYIYSNLRYPEKARDEGIEGMVVIRFVIETDGSISNANIIRDIGGGCGVEAKKVVESMNHMKEKWIPGKKDNALARVSFTLPVKFKLAYSEQGNKMKSKKKK